LRVGLLRKEAANVYPVHVLGFSGSLRKGSCNAALLRASQEMLPAGMTLETFELAPIPLFNQDFLDAGDFPESDGFFKSQIAAADALLIATPEYNYSIPSVLKNSIDWASRPAKGSPLNGKPLAIMAAGGMMGTSRAQYHLRQVAVCTNMFPFNTPEVTVPMARQKFDVEGRLTDELTRSFVRQLLEALYAWTNRLRGTV
jgi:chromate reductase, NAD(P)H dehydrogenase (quinone)